MDVFCIHLPHRKDREENLKKIDRLYGSLRVTVVEGIKHENGAIGCLLSHQKILRMAKEQNRPYVWIIEDDCKFIPTNGGVLAYARIITKFLTDNPTVQVVNGCGNLADFEITSVQKIRDLFFLTAPKVFTTHCIFYSASAYDDILALDTGVPIDSAVNKMKMVFTWPFLATQVESYSDIEEKDVNYDNIIHSNNFIISKLQDNGLLEKYG